MRTSFYLIFLTVIAVVSLAGIQITETCDVTALKAELKTELKPKFKYDSSKTSRFSYKTKEQVKEIEIPLFMGEKYRFLFNTSCLTKNIKIEIHNKPIGHKKRTLLYSLDLKEGQTIYSYEPEKSRKMYITYTIPKVETPILEKDCLVFVVGYQIKVLKNM